MNVLALIVSGFAAAAAIAAVIYARQLGAAAKRASDLLHSLVGEQIKASKYERAAALSAMTDDTIYADTGTAALGIYTIVIRNADRGIAERSWAWIELAPADGQSEPGPRFGNTLKIGVLGRGESERFVRSRPVAAA